MIVDADIIAMLEDEARARADSLRSEPRPVIGGVASALEAEINSRPAQTPAAGRPPQAQESNVNPEELEWETADSPGPGAYDGDDVAGDDDGTFPEEDGYMSAPLYSSDEGVIEGDEVDDLDFPVVSGNLEGGPPIRGTAVPGSTEARIAALEEQNKMLMAQIEQLPNMLQQAISGGGGLGQQPPQQPAAAGGGILGAVVNNLGPIMGMAKQFGLMGGDKPAQQAGPNQSLQFLEQMSQFLNVQSAMEQLQMQKLDNTTKWLGRMMRAFGKDALPQFVKANEAQQPAAEAEPQPSFTGYVIPPAVKQQLSAPAAPVIKPLVNPDDDEEDDDE